MSIKGSNTTSDYIEYDIALDRANSLLRSERKIVGLYIIVAINTGLRISDILKLNWIQLRSDTIKINEQKTGKRREVKVNEQVQKAVSLFDISKVGPVFIGHKKKVYTTQTINRILKEVFEEQSDKLNVSSHSLRKSFGRRVFERNGESDKALTYLSELFNHTSPLITRKYLGIRQEELNGIYDNIV